jgi:hypothetical protein
MASKQNEQQSGVGSGERQDILVGALAIFGLLLVIYLLTFNGRFTSIDELAIYSQAESLIQQGNLATPQLAFSEYHNTVSEIEPGFAIVAAPLYWLAQQGDRFNNIQLVMLLNPLLTAATGAVLYAIARTLGYSHKGSALAALAFGLTTLAWPYSRGLYREPLVGLGWSLGLYGLVLWRYREQVLWAGIGCLILVLTLTVKVTAIVALPFIFLAALAQLKERKHLGRLAIILAFITLITVLLFQAIFTSRYGSASALDLLSQWSLATGLLRTYGQLLSPGKGLIFYMPVVILTVPGLVIMWRQHRAVTLAIALPLLTTAVSYSSYGSWFGGQSWGPRFLVPAVPLIMLAIAPLWDATKQRWLRGLYLAILAFSLVIQLGVVTTDWWSGYEPLFETGPNPEDNAGLQPANILLSPPLAQLRAWGTDIVDLLWFHPIRQDEPAFSPWLALGLVVAVLAACLAWWLIRRKGLPAVILLLPPTMALIIVLLLGPGATPGYPGMPAEEGKGLAAWAGSGGPEPYTLITMSNEYHIFYYLGFLKGDFIHHWYSPDQREEFDPILEQTLGQQVALVMDRVHIDPAFSGKDLEWWLNEQLFRVGSEWLGGYELVRYANLRSANLPTQEWSWQQAGYQFGDSFLLRQFAVSQTQLQPGQTLGLQLEICRSGPEPDFHHLFTHLQGSGVQISGHDGPLRYGGTSVVPWDEGDCLIERRARATPDDALPGPYDIIAGFDTPAGPLPVQDGEAGGHIVLGQVTVIP